MRASVEPGADAARPEPSSVNAEMNPGKREVAAAGAKVVAVAATVASAAEEMASVGAEAVSAEEIRAPMPKSGLLRTRACASGSKLDVGGRDAGSDGLGGSRHR